MVYVCFLEPASEGRTSPCTQSRSPLFSTPARVSSRKKIPRKQQLRKRISPRPSPWGSREQMHSPAAQAASARRIWPVSPRKPVTRLSRRMLRAKFSAWVKTKLM